MKNCLITILIIQCFCNALSGNDLKEKLELSIELEKDKFNLHESIFGDVKLTNISNETIEIRSIFELYANYLCFLTCEGINNEFSGYFIRSLFQIDNNFKLKIAPNESLIITFNLLRCMGKNDKSGIHEFYIPEDSYNLQATFYPDAHDLPENEEEIELKSVKSEKVQFKVKNEINIIYNNADLNFLKESLKDRNKTKNHTKFCQEMIDFIKKYPKSIYLDAAFIELLITLRINLEDNLEFYKWLKKAYEIYYDHYFFGEFLLNWIPPRNRLHLDKYKNEVSEIYTDFSERFKHSKGMRYLEYKEEKYRKLGW